MIVGHGQIEEMQTTGLFRRSRKSRQLDRSRGWRARPQVFAAEPSPVVPIAISTAWGVITPPRRTRS